MGKYAKLKRALLGLPEDVSRFELTAHFQNSDTMEQWEEFVKEMHLKKGDPVGTGSGQAFYAAEGEFNGIPVKSYSPYFQGSNPPQQHDSSPAPQKPYYLSDHPEDWTYCKIACEGCGAMLAPLIVAHPDQRIEPEKWLCLTRHCSQYGAILTITKEEENHPELLMKDDGLGGVRQNSLGDLK